uniref:Uncharacterized protein n=1 Tax=Kalanchoe fedtschenkoi TaxID=63787 RepID=A0A7N0R926_KALFE
MSTVFVVVSANSIHQIQKGELKTLTTISPSHSLSLRLHRSLTLHSTRVSLYDPISQCSNQTRKHADLSAHSVALTSSTSFAADVALFWRFGFMPCLRDLRSLVVESHYFDVSGRGFRSICSA